MIMRGSAAAALIMSVTATLVLASTPTRAAKDSSEDSGGALLKALTESDTVLAESLVAQHAKVNARDETGATPLMFAAQLNAARLAEKLLDAGADPNIATAEGLTALQVAIANQAAGIALSLIRHGARANVVRSSGETALMSAARTGQAEIMRALLAGGADVNAHENKFHQTALMWSAGHPDQVKLLVKYGADIHVRTKSWDVTTTRYLPEILKVTAGEITGDGWTHDGEYVGKEGGESALFFAVWKDDLESVRSLLDAGADVNDAAADGSTALLRALYKWDATAVGKDQLAKLSYYEPKFRPNLAIANLLLDRGAKVSVADIPGYTPLHGAVLSLMPEGRRESLEAALHGGDLSPPKTSKPVADPVEALALVKRLLSLGANPNAATRNPTGGPILQLRLNPAAPGSSPVHIAALSQNLELMNVLLAHGGDPNLLRQDGHSPFSAAVKANDLPMVEMLAAHGADLQRVYSPTDFIADPELPVGGPMSGQTALHIASAAGAHDVIPFLVQHGVSLTRANAQGKTPLQLADEQERFRHVFVISLEKVKAKDNKPHKDEKSLVRATDTSDVIKKLMASKPS